MPTNTPAIDPAILACNAWYTAEVKETAASELYEETTLKPDEDGKQQEALKTAACEETERSREAALTTRATSLAGVLAKANALSRGLVRVQYLKDETRPCGPEYVDGEIGISLINSIAADLASLASEDVT